MKPVKDLTDTELVEEFDNATCERHYNPGGKSFTDYNYYDLRAELMDRLRANGGSA